MKNNIICDLDGTIALDTHRNHLLQQDPRPWDQYFDLCGYDEPNWPVINLLEDLCSRNNILILTGRSERVRELTVEWLARYEVPYHFLMMREVNDRTDDNNLKIGWAEKMGLRDKTRFVLEDRSRVVEAWRKAGYPCFQVAPGTF